MSESWVEKHRPEHWKDIQGNGTAIRAIKDWAKEFEPGDPPQLLVGPPGTGKTSTAHVLADKMGWPTNETNASDARSSDALARLARQINSTPADAAYQLVVIDEVDSQSGNTNKQPLYDALDDARNPVILIGNDEYEIPRAIRNRAELHEFSLQDRSIKSKLRKVADAEGLDYTDADLETLAERGGLRAAIHDLQAWAEEDVPPGEDTRDDDPDEFEVMDRLLRGEKDSGEMAPPDVVLWLDENVSNEYEGVAAMTAYDCLSRADKWLDRARREDYRYWKYAGALAEQVAAVRITEPYDGWLSKDFPEWFRHSTPNPEGGSDEAKLYRALKDYEDGSYQFAGSFAYFRSRLLPLLREMDVEDRMALALAHGLDSDEMAALDLTQSQFENWAEQDVPDDRHQTEAELKQTDALSW